MLIGLLVVIIGGVLTKYGIAAILAGIGTILVALGIKKES